MEFNSIEEAIAFVERSVSNSMPKVGEDIKEIMDNETGRQVKGWTEQIFDSVESNANDISAEAEFTDNGDWYSIITGDEVGNPIKFLEAGTTWNRSASNIMDESFNKCQQEIPEKLRQYLMAMGIPIE